MPKENAPSCTGVLIHGNRGRLFGTLYTPEGCGPFPVIIICHGFPGNERLLDIAVYLREHGFCTLHFHYSGSWGSDGDFSFANCFEDADSVISYVKENKSGIFDTSKIYMIGHSMGGLVACRCAAMNESISVAAIIMPGDIGGYFEYASQSDENEQLIHDLFDDCGQWLNGYSWNQVKADWLAFSEEYTLSHYAKQLAEKPILFVAGSDDPSPKGESDIYPLWRSVERYGLGKATIVKFDTDHCMNRNRSQIKEQLNLFFSKLK